MTPTLLGAPLALYSIPAFLLAFIWLFVWPRQVAPPSGLRRLILRWGHALVWFLLGMAALVGGSPGFGGPDNARILALASAAVYAIFVVTLVTASRKA